jgi:hypothetical protein
MVNLTHIIWGRSSYISILGKHYYMTTQVATEMHGKKTHLGDMKYIEIFFEDIDN